MDLGGFDRKYMRRTGMEGPGSVWNSVIREKNNNEPNVMDWIGIDSAAEVENVLELNRLELRGM